jgi:hypothetical protein
MSPGYACGRVVVAWVSAVRPGVSGSMRVATGYAADYYDPPPILGIVRKFRNAFRHGLRSLETWGDSERST